MSYQGDSDNTDSLLLIIGSVILILFLYFGLSSLYGTNRELINTILLFINKIFLLPCVVISSHARTLYFNIGKLDPSELSWDNIVVVCSAVGHVAKYYIVVLAGALIFVNNKYLKEIIKFKRNFNINKLLENNAKVFPCVAPIVGRNVLDADLDSGPWRTARTPIQFVAENNLLLNKQTHEPISTEHILKDGLPNVKSPLLKDNSRNIFDRECAKQIFISQLGELFKGPEHLPYHQRGLAAALLAFGHADKKKGQSMFDQMSLSFVEGGYYPQKKLFFTSNIYKPPFVDIDGADEIIEKYKDSKELKYHTYNHDMYVTTWFHALLRFAREKGVVSTAQFIWLRPMDRLLFYTLNQVGGRTSFAEASGPWAHFLAEEAAERTIEEPEVDEAVSALEVSLIETGWLPIPESMIPKPKVDEEQKQKESTRDKTRNRFNEKKKR